MISLRVGLTWKVLDIKVLNTLLVRRAVGLLGSIMVRVSLRKAGGAKFCGGDGRKVAYDVLTNIIIIIASKARKIIREALLKLLFDM